MKNRRGAHHLAKKNRTCLIRKISILLFVICVLFFGNGFVSAQKASEKQSLCKYYKSIEVASGDTLWTIADKYFTSEYDSKAEYIEEVLEINQMDSTDLYADQKLIVPYYAYTDSYTASLK